MTCFKTTIVLSKTKNKQQATSNNRFFVWEKPKERRHFFFGSGKRSENGSNGSKQRSRSIQKQNDSLKRGWPASSFSSSSPFLPFQKLFYFVWLYPSFIQVGLITKQHKSTQSEYRTVVMSSRKHQGRVEITNT